MTATTGRWEPEADVVMEAAFLGACGDRDGAMRLLEPIIRRGPGPTCGTLAALAELYLGAMGHSGRTEPFGLAVMNPHGERLDAREMALPQRFAGQFLTACANRDANTAVALFRAVVEHDMEHGTMHAAEGFSQVFNLTTRALRDMQGEDG